MAWENIVPRKRKTPKIRQIVWLDYKTTQKLYEWAEKYDAAPNTIIAEIVKKALLEHSDIFDAKPAETKTVTLVVCPLCWKTFPDLATVKKHLQTEHKAEELKNFLLALGLEKEGEKQ